MPLPDSTSAPSTRQLWTGRVLTAFAVLFLVFDLTIKFLHIVPVTESFARLGIPDHLAFTIGALELLCLLVYLVPRTAVLGAILLTGFLGGAIMLHVRVGDPLFSHILFRSYIGAMLWIGLYLRDSRLRTLLA
jgi:DoxX-like family